MPNYRRSSIYVIRAPNVEEYYIGSTTQKPSDRFKCHMRHYDHHVNRGKFHWLSSYQILRHPGAYVEVLERFPCRNRRELEQRERELISAHPLCCNKAR